MKRFHPQLVALVLLAAANWAAAAPVPVFRHALDHWPSRAVYLTVGLAKTPSLRDRGLMKSFEAASLDQRGTCNYRLRLEYHQVSSHISIAAMNPDVEDVAPFYTAVLNEATLNAVLTSPLRAKIASELQTGKAGVWLYVEDKSLAAKQAATIATTITNQGKHLSQTDLPIAFTLHTLTLDKASQIAEAVLLGQLADLSPSMTIAPGTLFCITGRGLIIAALGPEQATEDNITAVCEFLASPYSDDLDHLKTAPALLLNADWDNASKKSAPAPAPPAQTDTESSPKAPAVVRPVIPTIPAAAKPTLIDKIPWIYLVGLIMAGWIGFMFYRIKQEVDSQKRMNNEEE